MNREVECDIQYAKRIMNGDWYQLGYGRLYYCSNENLAELFRNFSVEGKDVLTVLASSDQLFHTYYHGARSVDSFDINKLTKYYYYLRRWIIDYFSTYYPDEEFFENPKYLRSVLEKVECADEDEDKAFQFWNLYTHVFSIRDTSKLYFYSNPDTNKISDIQMLKERLDGKKLTFYHQDLCDEVYSKKKYDIIITSNILEYYGNSPMKLMRCRDNLNSLLKEDGMVVCSYMMDHSKSYERDVFIPRFCCYEFLNDYEENDYSMNLACGYTYKKRVLTKNS